MTHSKTDLPKEFRRKAKPKKRDKSYDTMSPEHRADIHANEELDRLDRLCVAYGVGNDEKKYLGLAYLLAVDYIPAFLPAAKNGAKIKWTPVVKGLLLLEMERLINKVSSDKGVAYAARHLAKDKLWKAFITPKKTYDRVDINSVSKTLQNYYSKYKNQQEAKHSRDDLARIFADYESKDWQHQRLLILRQT